jgi:hypothetical protein
MKTDIDTLKESFWAGYDAYLESRKESEIVWNMYHNRQWTDEQQNILENRGQPKETFNVIKLFARMLVGYYSTVMNTVRAEPVQYSDSTVASLVTDVISAVFESNDMEIEGDNIKLSGIVSGVMCASCEPYFTGKRDSFGRPLYDIRIRNVPDYEIVLDPMSTAEDYSDASFMHRFKWLPEDAVRKIFGQATVDKLTAYENQLNIEEAEFDYNKGQNFYGRYRIFNNYLIVHTVIEDDDGKRWSIFWSGDQEIRRDEITYQDVKWSYRVTKIHTSNYTEYYGVFREVIETQKAINQAIVKLQLMANSQKVFVQNNAVENVDEFTAAVNRVTGVIPVKDIMGIKVENMAREALEQYQIIDRALDRIQRILHINDSFLGMAYASDSGRKVKLQQNAAIMALRYLTVRIESFYKLLGRDVAMLAKQYFTAEQCLRVTDEVVGTRFIELNKPMQIWNGQIDVNGQPQYEYVYEQVYNPASGEPETTEEGALVFAPINEAGTELNFETVDIKIATVAYNDEDERAQLMLESVMSGQIGQMLAQINPAGFFKVAGLSLRTMKTKYSPEISRILEETGAMLGDNPEQENAAALVAQGIGGSAQAKPMSQTLKLPTNTNEGPA